MKVYADWDWQGAEQEFKRASELNPDYPLAHHWYANMLLLPLGRHPEAIQEMQRALELDPLSLILTADLGCAYYFARRYDAAFDQYQTKPSIPASCRFTSISCSITGRPIRRRMVSRKSGFCAGRRLYLLGRGHAGTSPGTGLGELAQALCRGWSAHLARRPCCFLCGPGRSEPRVGGTRRLHQEARPDSHLSQDRSGVGLASLRPQVSWSGTA